MHNCERCGAPLGKQVACEYCGSKNPKHQAAFSLDGTDLSRPFKTWLGGSEVILAARSMTMDCDAGSAPILNVEFVMLETDERHGLRPYVPFGGHA